MSQFLVMSYSMHQLVAGLECPGKASNATAAGVELSSICWQHKILPAFVNVTVMDADTLISHRQAHTCAGSSYECALLQFACVRLLALGFGERYHLRLDNMLTAWQAAGQTDKVINQLFTPYMSFCNVDDRAISSVVAATDLIWGMTQIFHITRATPIRFAVSTYSLSLHLLERTGYATAVHIRRPGLFMYWEVGDAGIGEDTHEALKVFFATNGEARTVPVYETFRCQCLHGEGFVNSCKQRYQQAARHALGHIDMGYTLHKCWTRTCIPIRLRFIAVLQTFEIVYWMMGVMLGWGAAVSNVVIFIATYTNPQVCYRGGTLERVACYHDVQRAGSMDDYEEELTYAVAPKSAGSTPSNSYGDLEALDA
ncbi:MAG: hypothetical protein SGPRY_012533, partial [Prymnesium sp.]